MIERIRLRLLRFQIHSILWLYVLLFLEVVEGGLLVLPLASPECRTSHQRNFGGQVGRTFSSKMKQARSAAQCSGDRGLKTPPNIISVNINSSPVEISHATRPFISTTSSAVVNPSRRRTLFLDFSSSRWRISCTEFNFRFRALTLSIAVCLRSNRSYSAGSDGELERGRV
jgi:hypothetical protein